MSKHESRLPKSSKGVVRAWSRAALATGALLAAMGAPAWSADDLAERIVGERDYIARNLSNGFKVAEAGVIRDLPPDARRAGVKVAAGFLVEGAGARYSHILLTYSIFQDARQAESRARELHADAEGVILTNVRGLQMQAPPGRRLHIKGKLELVCGLVDMQDLSVNCSVNEPNNAVLVSIVIGPGAPAPGAKAGESQVQHVGRAIDIALTESARAQDAIVVPALAALNRALGN